MNAVKLQRLSLLASSALFAVTAVATPLHAQTVTDAETPQDAIIVTGTRIQISESQSPVPVTSVTGDQFFTTGELSAGDVLNELPALRSTYSLQNSTRSLGTGGLNLLDLRGLGTVRSLVLVNGRRHVGSDILLSSSSVDVNSIPSALIERVDLVTGGSSAVYGSDAIAGVVNFVLKQDYEGIELRGQNGVSQYGDANSYFISGLAGTNFSGGRGNVVLSVEYARQDALYASDRPHTAKVGAYIVQDMDAPGTPNGSDGVPDRVFFKDLRQGYYANGGTIMGFGPGGLTPYIFQPNGMLVPQTGERINDPTSPVPAFVGGNGNNFREGKLMGLRPSVDRLNVNLIGHFEVSPSFVPFFEAKYARTDSLSNNAGTFTVPTYGIESFYSDNPYLTDQARSLIHQLNGAPDNVVFPFQMFRTVTDLGPRREDARRETYRLVGGARGEISSNWSYEASFNYGEFRNKTRVLGNPNFQRYLLSADAVRDPTTDEIVCRAKINPGAAFPNPFAQNPSYAASQLAADIAACEPGNFFGEGNVSQAARDYILQDTVSRGKITQFVANAYVMGDTAGLLELPGGPVGLVLGGEYRRETAYYRQDELLQAGQTTYNVIPTFDPPSFEVAELFGEARLPILADVPGAHKLTVNLAGRVADYKGATGTVFAYNSGLQYAPVRDLTLRANFSRAVRAPNLSERYTPLGANFANNFADPCSTAFLAQGSANRVANCSADGVPNGFNYLYTTPLRFLSGGNPNLREEKSDSITFGALYQPQYVPGLSISVDYFDIKVKNVITSATAQQIVNACYDAESLNNQFCDLFARQGAGTGPQGEATGRILEGSLQVPLLNYANLKVRGIDVNALYSRPVEAINGSISARLAYTHMLQNDQFLDLADPGRADQLLMELGYPKDSFNFDFGVQTGPLTLGYQMRYIGKAVLHQYEDLFSKQGRDPQNADYAEDRFYTDVFYHDIRMSYAVDRSFDFYLGVDNVGNRLPPQGLTGATAGGGLYGVLGRYFYAGVKVNFAGLGL